MSTEEMYLLIAIVIGTIPVLIIGYYSIRQTRRKKGHEDENN